MTYPLSLGESAKFGEILLCSGDIVLQCCLWFIRFGFTGLLVASGSALEELLGLDQYGACKWQILETLLGLDWLDACRW